MSLDVYCMFDIRMNGLVERLSMNICSIQDLISCRGQSVLTNRGEILAHFLYRLNG